MPTNRPKFPVIQVGANDGITHDLIHKFIKRDQWQGVLLEPQLAVFARLQQLYHKTGRSPAQGCYRRTGREAIFIRSLFSQARWATGLASFNKEVILQAFASGYVGEPSAGRRRGYSAAETDRITAESIPVISPATLDRTVSSTIFICCRSIRRALIWRSDCSQPRQHCPMRSS